MWAEHYCKASWIFGANVYAITGDIETAKVINVLMMYVAFVFSFDFLAKKVLKSWQALIVSFLLVFNPVMICQVFTSYIDNLLMSSLFAVIILLVKITMDSSYIKFNKIDFFALFCSIIICINIKFTGLAYAGAFCFTFYILWLLFSYREDSFKESIIKITSFYIVTCSIAIFLVGFSSYVMNFIQHGNPLYPLLGEGKVDIMTGNQPAFFDDISGPERLFYSAFSETSNMMGDLGEPKLKKPFDVSEAEIEISKLGIDMRIGGFGPWFSGILCISLCIILGGISYLLKANKKFFIIVTTIFLLIIFLLLFIKESWWARYSPYFWLLPVIALILLFSGACSLKKVWLKAFLTVCAMLFALCIFRNSMFSWDYLVNCKKVTSEIKGNLHLAEIMSQKYSVNIKLEDNAFYGLEFNFRDNGIKYKIVKNVGENSRVLYYNKATMEVIR